MLRIKVVMWVVEDSCAEPTCERARNISRPFVRPLMGLLVGTSGGRIGRSWGDLSQTKRLASRLPTRKIKSIIINAGRRPIRGVHHPLDILSSPTSWPQRGFSNIVLRSTSQSIYPVEETRFFLSVP